MTEFLEADYCFACGCGDDSTERAHILARANGGGDGVENIHLLCPVCHQDSESLDAVRYNEWLLGRHLLDGILSRCFRVGMQPTHLLRGIAI